MKKGLLAILTLLYLMASLGFSLQIQHCAASKTDLSQCISKMCGKCSNENLNKKDNTCCRNENRFVKNDKDQIIPESVFHPTPSNIVALHSYFVESLFNQFASVSEVVTITHAPPPDDGVSIFLRDRVFRI
ncbi:MAG: HYC_CC_PP family protein [Ginsengibacter sp.]